MKSCTNKTLSSVVNGSNIGSHVSDLSFFTSRTHGPHGLRRAHDDRDVFAAKANSQGWHLQRTCYELVVSCAMSSEDTVR